MCASSCDAGSATCWKRRNKPTRDTIAHGRKQAKVRTAPDDKQSETDTLSTRTQEAEAAAKASAAAWRETAPVKALRRKFVIAAEISLVISLSLVIAGIMYFYLTTNAERSDSIIDVLYENDGQFPAPTDTREPSISPRFTVNLETEYENRYAWVRCEADGSISEINLNHIAIGEDQIRKMAETALRSGQDRGYQEYYRYGVFENDDGSSMVILLDCYQRQQAAMTVLRVSIIVAFICVALVSVLLIPFSRAISRPYARNLARQQRFVTDASHELKTPLAIIAANNELTEQLSGETQWTRSTKTQIARLASLTRDLIDIARSTEMPDRSSMPMLDLSILAERVVEDVRPLAEVAGKEIRTSIEKDIMVKGSDEALERLMNLLLTNAVKHGDESGIISLSLARSRKTATLSVSNPASNLKAEVVDRLFDRFYRADSTSARSTSGYGIGLSVAQSIVERHGGKLAASKEGDLAVFAATLPLCN